MAATLDNVTQGSQFSGVTSDSFSHEVSGTNRLLVVTIHFKETEGVDSVTYNGTSLTRAVRRTWDGEALDDGQPQVEIWYLVNPDTGTNTVQLNFSNDAQEGRAAAISYNGIGQNSPLDTTGGDDGDGSTVSASVTPSVDNCLIVDAGIFDDQAASMTPQETGQTERVDFEAAGGIGVKGFSSDILDAGTAASETMSWSSSESELWSDVIAVFKAPSNTAPNAPTLETADDTETTDTTPSLDFNAVDDQGDDVTYQIQIDTDINFGTPDVDSVSDTDAGFSNIDTGADTDPFNSGDTVRFTVQGADELTRGSYYWRVRAKDPNGTNTFGDWSNTRAFHIFKTDREVTLSSVANVPSNTSHQYADDSEAFTDSEYTNIDSDDATRISKTANTDEVVYSLQKKDLGSGNFDINFDGQVSSVSVTNAISHDNTTGDTEGPVATSHTFSHTVGSGDGRYLLVFVAPTGATDVTYNGVSLTKITTVSGGNNADAEVWGLADPASGTNTVEVFLTSSYQCIATSYENVDAKNTETTNSGSGTSASTDITTTLDDCMLVDGVKNNDTGGGVWSADTGQTERGTAGPTVDGWMAVSTKTVGGAGTYSMGWSGDSHTWGHIVVALAPTTVDAHVKIDLYNQTSGSWENLLDKTDMSADTDFSHSTSKTTSTSDYYDGNGFIYARVYTEHETTLRIDQFTITAGTNQQTASVSPVTATTNIPAVTATYQSVQSAIVSPVTTTTNIPTPTATYVLVETASVSPVTVSTAVVTPTATYQQVESATVSSVSATTSIPTPTATYQSVQSAGVSPVASITAIPTPTATYTQVETASVTAVSGTFVIPTVSAQAVYSADVSPVVGTFSIPTPTATYQSVQAASTTPVTSSFAIVDPTATYVQVETASVSPEAATFVIPTPTASYTQVETASVSPLSSTFSVVAVTAIYTQVNTATVSPVVSTTSIPTPTATFHVSAGVIPVVSTFSIPSITATSDQSNTADVDPVLVGFTIPAVTATYNQLETASVTPLSVSTSVNTVTATSSEVRTASVSPLAATFSIPSVTATSSAVYEANISPLTATFNIPSVVPAGIINADVSPLVATFNIPSVSTTHISGEWFTRQSEGFSSQQSEDWFDRAESDFHSDDSSSWFNRESEDI